MSELGILRDLACTWIAALLAGFLCLRLKQPLVAGYILAGWIIGPFGLRLVSQSENIATISELGVALLLFALGVELSLRHVFANALRSVLSGLAQVFLTAILAFIYAQISTPGIPVGAAILFGFVCALSSTVVVVKVLSDRGEIDSSHGRLLIPILLIQDLSMVPIISLIPVLKNTGDGWVGGLLIAALKAALLIGIVMIGARKVVPSILHWVSKYNSREMFLLTVISICMCVAFTSYGLGMSLALGAFLAGIMVSEYPYGHQTLSDVMPLRDLFATVFFVSVGMQLNPGFIALNWPQVLCFVAVLMLGKAVVGSLAARITLRSWGASILTGLSLAQIGEFSFVMATLGHASGIFDASMLNLFYAGAVVSLIATPLLMAVGPKLIARFGGGEHLTASDESKSTNKHGTLGLKDHVLLCGYGRIGRNIGTVLKTYGIPFAVIEMNAGLMDDLRSANIPHVYGDAFSRHVLTRANIRQAAAVIVTVPEAIVATSIISVARKGNKNVKILVRAHQTTDVDMFRTAGANAVVQPEFEASVELSRLVLMSLERSSDEIRMALEDLRTRRYSIFRPDIAAAEFSELVGISPELLSGFWFMVQGELQDETIRRLDVRKRTGATIVAIRRDETVIAHPAPDSPLRNGDEIYIAGNADQLRAFETTFKAARFCPMAEKTSGEV
ncbi:MAG: cation:proton antiporter [Candidatus Obscuribacterales bacterium]|nr:cation:proton antiporter [Candidatus Obscuribacterales bacterium]